MPDVKQQVRLIENCRLTVHRSMVYNSNTKQNKTTILDGRSLGKYIVDYPNKETFCRS